MEDVIEQTKAPIEDDFVESDEDEIEKKEELKEKSESTIRFSATIPKDVRGVIISTPGNASALLKIVYDGKLVEIGKGETHYKEKTSDTLKIYHVQDHNILIVQ